MRKPILCLCGGIAALAAMDYAVAGNGAALLQTALSAPTSAAGVNRAKKGDRQTQAAKSLSRHRIATVEVVGLEAAEIVYRDQQGRVLFRTDPVGNATVVMRGVTLPAVTVRETARTPVQPIVLEPPSPAPKDSKLPKDCEAAASALSASGSSALRARCFADFTATTRMAAAR